MAEGSTLKPEEHSPIEEQKIVIQRGVRALHRQLDSLPPDAEVRVQIAGRTLNKDPYTVADLQAHLNILEARSFILVDQSDLEELCDNERLAEIFIRWHDSLDSFEIEIVN